MVSGITTMVYLLPPDISTFQIEPTLKPSLWLNTIDLHNPHDEEMDKLFRVERNKFITEALDSLTTEMDNDNGATALKKKKKKQN